MKMDTVFVECDCHLPSHVAQLRAFELDDDYVGGEIAIMLNHYLPWYKRILPAIGYLFGKREAEFDSVLVNREQTAQVVEWANYVHSRRPI
jgi:hypothetical protein